MSECEHEWKWVAGSIKYVFSDGFPLFWAGTRTCCVCGKYDYWQRPWVENEDE
jgi:hypothetical protein